MTDVPHDLPPLAFPSDHAWVLPDPPQQFTDVYVATNVMTGEQHLLEVTAGPDRQTRVLATRVDLDAMWLGTRPAASGGASC